MMKKIFLYGLLLLVLWSCGEGNKKTEDSRQQNKPLANPVDNYWLTVDQNTSIYNFLSQPANIDGVDKFLLFSTNANSLLIYDIRSQSLQKKVAYSKEGPDAITGLGVSSGMCYVNEDTVLYYSREQELLFVANTSGEVYSKLKLTNERAGFGSVDLYSPMAYRKGYVYLQSLPIVVGKNAYKGPSRANKVAKISLETGEFEEIVFDYPSEYKDKDISMQLKMMDIVYNPSIDKFIISFPLAESIYVTDFAGYNKAYSAKSDLVKQFVEYDNKSKDVPESQRVNYYYWLSDAYGRLMFDPVSGHYFREARSAISKQDYLSRKMIPNKEVLVLDSNFNRVRVIPHSGAWIMYHFFNEGQIFWNKDFNEFNVKRNNEDTLYFDRVEFLNP